MPASFPTSFGRYQLVERLAIGGMAELFKARVLGAHGFQKPVVIKKILSHLAADSTFVAMFIDEAKITARLDHPKIAQVLELGAIEGQLFMAMEFVEGLDVLALLRACAQRERQLPPELAAHIAHEVLDALEYAHSMHDDEGHPLNIIHRDISPSNVLLSRRGDVKLADFGIAHAVERHQKTQAGTLKGKYGYMSPEQVTGNELDCRSDLFSVGILLAEMLMGRHLFTAPNHLDVLLMVRDVRLERLQRYGSAIAQDLRAILLTALERDPANRYQTAAEFRDALGDWVFTHRHRVAGADLVLFMTEVCGDQLPKPRSGPSRADPRHSGFFAAIPAGVQQAPPTEVDEEPSRPTFGDNKISLGALAQAAAVSFSTGQNIATEPSAAVPEHKSNDEDSGPLVTIEEAEVQVDAAATFAGAGARASASATASAIPQVVIDAGSRPIIEGPRTDTTRSKLVAAAAAPSQKIVGPPSGMLRAPAAIPPPPAQTMFGATIRRAPDEEGSFGDVAPLRVLHQLVAAKETGLLMVQSGGTMKEIVLALGVPEYASSNVAREYLGEYLVEQKVISAGELSMALAAMPLFGGKLGDTLVGLGLLQPIEVFRHLSRQVRGKIVDVVTWTKGTYRYFHGEGQGAEPFPTRLDPYEVIGAGAMAIAGEALEAWSRPLLEGMPTRNEVAKVFPEAFRMGSTPRDALERFDGQQSLRELLSRFTDLDARLQFLRVLHLLVQTDLIELR